MAAKNTKISRLPQPGSLRKRPLPQSELATDDKEVKQVLDLNPLGIASTLCVLQNAPAVKRVKTTTNVVAKPTKTVKASKTNTTKAPGAKPTTSKVTKATIKPVRSVAVTKAKLSSTTAVGKTSLNTTSAKAQKRPAWDIKGQLQVSTSAANVMMIKRSIIQCISPTS